MVLQIIALTYLVSIQLKPIDANVIERHFTLSNTMKRPARILYLEPGDMALLSEMATRIPVLLGNCVKRILASKYVTLNN